MKNIYTKTELELVTLSDWLSAHEISLIPFTGGSIKAAAFLNLTPLPLARKLYVLTIASELTELEAQGLTDGVAELVIPVFESYYPGNTSLRDTYQAYKTNSLSEAQKKAYIEKAAAATKLANRYGLMLSLFRVAAGGGETERLHYRNQGFQLENFDSELSEAIQNATTAGISQYAGSYDNISTFQAYRYTLLAQAAVWLLFKPVFYRPATNSMATIIVSQSLMAVANLAETVGPEYVSDVVDFAAEFVG